MQKMLFFRLPIRKKSMPSAALRIVAEMSKECWKTVVPGGLARMARVVKLACPMIE